MSALFPTMPLLVAGLLFTAGCGLAEYREAPLDLDALVNEVERSRADARAAMGANPVTLPFLEQLCLRRDPAVRTQLAAYRASRALVDVEARLQDPTLGIGANGAVGAGVSRRRVGAPALSLSVPVPISDRRGRENARDLALVELERARLERAARLAVLNVRSLFVEAALAGERLRARREIAEIARALAEAGESLVATGLATSLDLALLRLEATRAEQAVFDAGIADRAARAALAQALLMQPSDLESAPIDAAPDSWLAAAEARARGGALLDIARAARTDLAALEAEYAAAETELALQIARQVKDIGLGASISPEPAEAFTIVGILLSGALPIFRRNAQGIASAFAERARVRTRYGIALDSMGANLAAAQAAVERAGSRSEFLRAGLVPATSAVAQAAELGVEAGSASPLALLDATRSRVEVAFLEVTARQAVVRAWLAVERAVESPLLGVGARDAAEWSLLQFLAESDEDPGAAPTHSEADTRP